MNSSSLRTQTSQTSPGINLAMDHLTSPGDELVTEQHDTLLATGVPTSTSSGIASRMPIGGISVPIGDGRSGNSNNNASKHYSDHSSGFGHEFYRRLVEARNITDGHLEYGYAVFSIILGSVIGLGFLLLTAAIPVAMIAIGAHHLNNCPAIPELPILLIVSGSILAFGSLVNIGDQLLEGYVLHTNGKRKSRAITVINVLVVGLMVAALVLGCIWVYGRNVPNEYPEVKGQPQAMWCHPTVYQFSYWLLNISLVFIGLMVLLTLIGMITSYSI